MASDPHSVIGQLRRSAAARQAGREGGRRGEVFKSGQGKFRGSGNTGKKHQSGGIQGEWGTDFTMTRDILDFESILGKIYN